MLIIETPNPENLQVGAQAIFLDPTRVCPLPPALLSLVVREIGRERIQILRLDAYQTADSGSSSSAPTAAVAIELPFGPRDHAVVALKPA